MKLPVLLVCEDNGYAVHIPRHLRHVFQSIEAAVKPFDCAFYMDDSNDVESIYSMTKKAIAHIDHHGGPVLLQIKCERYLEHVGVGFDFDQGYQTKKSVDDWIRDKDWPKLERQRLKELAVLDETLYTIVAVVKS